MSGPRFSPEAFKPRLARGRYRECLADCDVQVARGDAGYSVHMLRSGLRLLTGDCAGGWVDLMRAYELNPRFMSQYAEGEERGRAERLSRESLFLQESHGIPASVLIAALDAQLVRTPKLAVAWAWRGGLRRRQLDYERAVADLERAWSLGLHTALVLTWRGEARLQLGDARGILDLEKALTLPCQAWNHAWCGRSKVAFRRSPEALTHLDRAIALEPENGWYYAWRGEARRLLRLNDGMLADLDRALELDPGFGYEGWVRSWRGMACLALKRPADALRDFERSLELMPDYPLSRSGRAQALRALGRWKDWFAEFEKASRLDLKYIQNLHSRPQAELESLLADVERVAALMPRSGAARRWRGLLLALTGKAAEAVAELDRALALAPDDAWAAGLRGMARWRAGDLEAALSDLARSLRGDPANALVWAWRAQLLAQRDRLKPALRDLDRALRLDQRFAWMFADRGRLKIMLSDPGGAVPDLKRALALNRDYVNAQVDLAVASGRVGDGKGRSAALARARALDKPRAAERLRLWSAYWKGRAKVGT